MDDPELIAGQISEMNHHFHQVEALGLGIKKKSTVESEKLRAKGNIMFTKNNHKHSQAQHKNLIEIYTKCIAYAPKDSEDLAKGFSNRAAALMHMQHYEEALSDIDRALLITQLDDLKAKLTGRKERCLELKNESVTDKKQLDEIPKMKPSKVLTNVSEAVGLKYNEKLKKQTFVATRDIPPGEFISLEKSYSCFPNKEQLYTACSNCLKFAWNAIPCDNCVFAIFCSEECKNEAMQEYHDIECLIIPYIDYTMNKKPWVITYTSEDHFPKIMFVIRAFVKAIKNEGFASVMNEIETNDERKDSAEKLMTNGILDFNKFRYHYNLLLDTAVANSRYAHGHEHEHCNMPEMTESHHLCHSDFHNALAIVTLLIKKTSILPFSLENENLDSADNESLAKLVHALMRLQNIFRCNCLGYQARSSCICTDQMNCQNDCVVLRGPVYAAVCSMFDHSCCPNVSKVFIPKGQVVAFTTTSVKKGEQLCLSYANFSQPKEERDKYLKEMYNIKCCCQACEENWSLHQMEEAITTVTASPNMRKVVTDFMKQFPKENMNFLITIFTALKDGMPRDKSTFEKLIVFSKLVYKYFDYRIAYLFCLQLHISMEKSYIEQYGEDLMIPKAC